HKLSSPISKLTPDQQYAFEYWVEDYKIVTFQRCLFNGYNRSETIRNLLKRDRSRHQDFAFGLPQYNYIDSLVQPIIQQAKADSIKFYKSHLEGRPTIEADDLNGIPLMKCCLEFYASEKLDSIAHARVNMMEQLWKN
ncbi:MAG: hypothetical protein AAGK97_04335, partial [Bacteroidota bacterium]